MTQTGVTDRVLEVRQRMTQAAERVHRAPQEIHLVAVTKGQPWEKVTEVCAAGIWTIGENRVQEAQMKFSPERRQDLIRRYPGFSLHLVGHLQTNKARRAVGLFDVIQSLDSVRLGECLERHAANAGKIQDCLVQLKLGDEPTKSGAPAQVVEAILATSKDWPHLRMCGMMAIAPWTEDPEASRPWFREARALFDRANQTRGGSPLRWLSLGMSHDFEAAIEEGANMIRIGAAIFNRGQSSEMP